MHFSVALCTFNGEKFIEEQLLSILNQSHPVSEIVISDDGSSDKTLEIIDKITSRLGVNSPTKVKVIQHEQPLGIAANFEGCINSTTHEWVFLSDQDDVWNVDKVLFFSDLIVKHPDKLFFCSDALLVDDFRKQFGYSLLNSLKVSDKERQIASSTEAFGVFLKRNIATGATVLLNKAVFDRAIPFPEGWIHDEWLAIVSSMKGEFFQSAKATIEYRQHESNSIGEKKLTLRRRISKYREPRNERNEHLAQRANELLDYIVQNKHNFTSVRYRMLFENASKFLEFHQKRLRLSRTRVFRLAPILRMFMAGEYFRYSRAPRMPSKT